MEKTSIYFSSTGHVKNTGGITKTHSSNPDNQTLVGEVPRREKGNINFEPPKDDDESSETAIQDKQMIEDCLDELDRKQDEIIKLLKRIEERLPTFTGRIVIKGS